MGLLDFMGPADDTVKDEFGMTRADRQAPIWSGLIKSGLMAVAGGGNLMPEERARYIAAAGGALGGIGDDMVNRRSQFAQQALRAQQLKQGPIELQMKQAELQGRQADVAQQAKWRQYADSPEFLKAMDAAKATPAERMAAQAAAYKGDFATVQKILDPKRNLPHVGADGTITYPDGRVTWINPITGAEQPLIGGAGAPGGAPVPGAPAPGAPAPGAQPPTIDKEIEQWSQPPQVAGTSVPKYGPDGSVVSAPQGYTPTVPTPASAYGYNEDVLKGQDPMVQELVRSVAEYRRKPSSILSGRGGPGAARAREQVMGLVDKYTNHTYDEHEFTTRQGVFNDFSSKGATGKNIMAIDTAYAHISHLYDLGLALKNGNTPGANAAINAIRTATGDARVNNFDTARVAVADELARAFKGANLSDTEIAEWKSKISSAASPAAMLSLVGNLHSMLEARIAALRNKYETDMKQPYKGEFLSPANRAKAAEIKAMTAAAATAQPGGAPAPAPDGAPAKTLQKGPDGVWRMQ